ncbi:MAG: ABC transporter permease [Vicinamibacterales bacterium]
MSTAGAAPLWAFLVRRLAFACLLVFFSSSASLLLVRLGPGDVTTEMRIEGVSPAALQAERARLNLDRSWLTQYSTWLGAAARLDFGMSFRYGRPVGPLVLERARNTGVLALSALLLATCVGIPLGIFTATHPQTAATRLIRFASVFALSWPSMLLSLVFAALAARTGWLPIGGMRSALTSADALSQVLDLGRHLVLPAAALAIPVGATFERLQSGALSASLEHPCVTAAATRGIPKTRLYFRHALRLALTPLVSVYGIVAGGLLGGSFGVEIVTAWPGLGRLLYEALISRDVYLVAGCAAVGSIFIATTTLASDLVAAWNDPRLREGAQ